MPQFLTDPSITLRGLREPESPWEILTRFAQLQQLQQAGRLNRLSEEEANLRLEQLRRLEGDKSAMRAATAVGVRPGFTMPAGGAGDAALMTDVQVPPRLDRAAMLNELAKGGRAYLVPETQQKFTEQDLENQKLVAQYQAANVEGKKKILDLHIARTGRIAQLAGGVNDQASYEAAIRQGLSEGVISDQDLRSIPPQYDPARVRELLMKSLTAKEQLEEARKDAELKLKQEGGGGALSDFESAFKRQYGRLPNATELEQHKARIAQAGRASMEGEDTIDVYASNLAAGRINVTDVPTRMRGRVLAAVEKGGNIVVPKPVRATLEQMDKAEGIVDIIEANYNALERAAGPEALAGGTLDAVLAKLQANPDAQMLRTQIGLLGNLARSISAERGVLTDRDVERAMQLLPQLTDRADVAKRKIGQLRGFIQNARRAATSSMNKKYPAAGPMGGTVRMVAPDGSEADVPADQVAAAEAAGAKRK